MEYQIEKGNRPRQPYAAVRATVSMAEIGDAMGTLYGKLFGWLGARNIQVAGEPWTRYLCIGPDELEFEAGVPISSPAEADGGVLTGTLAACDYVRTLHVGPYEGLGGAYNAIAAWMQPHGLQPMGAFWEVYLTDPESEPDPARWQTMIYCPVLPAPGAGSPAK